MTDVCEQGRPVALSRGACAGALIAATVGVAVCSLGLVIPSKAVDGPKVPDAFVVAVLDAALLLPALAVIGSLAGLAYAAFVRFAPRLPRAVRYVPPLAWMAVVFDYGASWWRAEGGGDMDLGFVGAMAAIAAIGGGCDLRRTRAAGKVSGVPPAGRPRSCPVGRAGHDVDGSAGVRSLPTAA